LALIFYYFIRIWTKGEINFNLNENILKLKFFFKKT